MSNSGTETTLSVPTCNRCGKEIPAEKKLCPACDEINLRERIEWEIENKSQS